MTRTTRALCAGVSALLGLGLVAAREAAAAIPTTERDALVLLYTSTGGPLWTNQANWLGPVGTECTWYGVTCDVSQSTVRSIDLSINGLSGTLPAALGNLANLQTLYLVWNQLTGAIPSTLGNLTSLQHLDLRLNQLTGAIPPTLGNLTNVLDLDLSSNQLTGAIPSTLGDMTNLSYLNLSSNQLDGAIPSTLGNLTNVLGLDLSSNQLTGTIPSTLGNLTQLQRLFLSANHLTGIPASLGNLTNLGCLDLHSNQLTGTIPSTLGNLNLRYLYLNSNQLTGAIPASFGNLTNLWYLDLHSNRLTGAIPATLGNLTGLNAFSLSSNQLTGAIPATFGNLTNVWDLDPAILGNLANLQYLSLASNKLTGTIPGLDNLTKLQGLFLSHNQLSGPIPPGLGSLAKLWSLYLDSNQLTHTIPAALGNLTNLTYLDLSDNRLPGAIPAELGALSKLQTLSLESNALQGSIPVSLANLTALTSLDLRWNLLSTTDPALAVFLAGLQPGWQNTQTVPPTKLMVFPATATSVTLTWTPLRFTESLGGYQVFMATSPGGGYSLFGTTSPKSGISTTVTGLPAGSTRYFALATVSQAHANNQNVLVSDLTMEGAGTTYALEPVQFSAAAYKVSEATPLATITVKRSGALTKSATVDYQTSPGTASSGVDYQPRAGTLTFQPYVAVRSFTIPIVNDTLDEPDETVLLRLQNPVNCTVGSQGTAVLTIVDNDAGGVLQYSAAAYTVGESAGSATITVRRTLGAAGNVSVSYAATAGTATEYVDFKPASGTLTFGAGQTVASFSVPILDDGIAEGAETVYLSLSGPTGGANLGPIGGAVLTIVDDESTVELGASSYAVTEGAVAVLTMKRTGNLSGTATVHYATSDGSAIAGRDYTAASGTLTFGPRVATRVVWVRTTNDTLYVSPKTPRQFKVSLDTPTGDVVLGQQVSATVRIQDNDPAGVVQFGAASYKVAEKGVNAVITVTRTGGTASGVTVHYSTAAGTAKPDTDYLDTSGTLSFAAGQTLLTFKVPILDDTEPEGAESVLLSLDTAGVARRWARALRRRSGSPTTTCRSSASARRRTGWLSGRRGPRSPWYARAT